MSSAKYTVSSVDKKPTYHKKLPMARLEAIKRANAGDTEITITNIQTGDRIVYPIGHISNPAKNNLKIQLISGSKEQLKKVLRKAGFEITK